MTVQLNRSIMAESGPDSDSLLAPQEARREWTGLEVPFDNCRWLDVCELPFLEADGVAIGRHETGGYAGRFAMELATVDSSAVTVDEVRLRQNQLVAAGEPQRQRALSALIGAIGVGQHLAFIHGMQLDVQGRPCYTMRIEGEAVHESVDLALEHARALQVDVRAALATGCPQFGFRIVAEPATTRTWPANHDRDLSCAAVAFGHGRRARAGFADSGQDRFEVALPFAPRTQQTFLDSLVAGLLAAPGELELRIELSTRCMSQEELQTVTEAVEALCAVDLGQLRVSGGGAGSSRPQTEDLIVIQAMLRAWCANAQGVDLKVRVTSDARVPEALLSLLGSEVLQGRPFTTLRAKARPVESELLDISALLPANAVIPALFPSPASLARLGMPRHYGDVRLRTPAEGIVLGDILTPFGCEVVRMADADRGQQCYAIGSTGTGKSELLCNLAVQDITEGRGVAVLDPHGDLYWEVLKRVPSERAGDVVLIDFTDFDHVPGLNLLEVKTDRQEMGRNFIIQDLTAIFRRLYGNVPESMGPMFFLYMRNAVSLVMEDPSGQSTLLDVPRVFADPTFRNYLLQNCKDAAVSDFWRGIAGPATGDSSLKEIAPYITNKFTEFTQNELVRNVVGQPKSTIDFRSVMDSRSIVLVNLSKGLLSELDTRFLGMLLTSRLFAAAASRASLPPSQRVPFHVYIDEFQNFTSDSLSSILAESRKYGLAMTLAHQDLGQVPSELRASLMANTGSKIIFRVGAADAEALAQYAAPQHSVQDLMTLPDYHAVARIKVSSVPSPPFVLRTRAAANVVRSAADTVRLQGIIDRSRQRYCVPVASVKARLEAHRYAHLLRLRLDSSFLDATSVAVFAEVGVLTMEDLVGISADARAELLGKVKTATDRARLQGLIARIA